MSDILKTIQDQLQTTRTELAQAVVDLDPAAFDYQLVLNRIVQGQNAFEQAAKGLEGQLMDASATTWVGNLYHNARVAISG